jgi:PAS domain S-box-containing protein
MSRLRLILCSISVVILLILSLHVAAQQKEANRQDLLTPEEQAWLSEHSASIRIGITEIPPQVLYGETQGDYKGLSIDYIRLVERHLNCKFELVYYKTWDEVMQAARNNDIDIIFAAQKTPERSEYLLFSTPYIELPNMIVVRKNMKGALTLDKMTGLKIVCSEGSAVHEFLRTNYGHLDIYPVKDELSGLIKVSFGEADAMVIELSRASYDIEKAKITNLRVAGNTDFTYQLRFASRKDWPVLNRILDKGLSSITGEDRDVITRKWIAIEAEPIFDGRVFWGVFSAGLFVMALILMGVILWNRTLKTRVIQHTGLLQRELLERMRAQDELFNSRQMLRSVLDNIPQRVFWKDQNLVFVGCNKPFALDCGYNDPGELVGKTSYETASAANADRYVADDREVVESGRPKINYEEPQVRPDGSQAWLITSKVPMYDQDGRVTGVLGTYADITRRRLMEEEIRQTNAYLENILDNSPDAIGIVDKHGRFIRLNKIAEDLYGYTFEEMQRKSPFDLYADKDELEKMLVNLRRDGSVRKWEMRMERKDGSIIPFEISIGLLKDHRNETLGSVCITRDLSGIKEVLTAVKASNERLYQEISERKQAEETVERLRRRNELILNSAGEGILGLCPEGRHTFVNPAATRMLGYAADELIGRKGHELYHHTREDGETYPEEDCPIVQAFRYGKFCQLAEEVFWRKDGTSFPVRYSSAPIIEEDKIVGAVVTFRDITEYKRGEKERKRLEEQLFQAQKMESVGRLAGGVAHDFNNMLGVIIGRAEMALEQDVASDKLRHDLQEILKAGLRSADLTRQLLAFARKQTALPKTLDLNDTISSMLKMLRRLIGEDINLLWVPELDLWKVKIDPSQVDQILANLVVNARDAISGVGAITLRTENVVIDDSNRAETPEFVPGEYILLSVSDNGDGMSKEVRENIFEPFFTTKELGKGTGLGLSTVYGIVKQNDGFIYVASEPMKGATFNIYLPRLETPIAQVPSKKSADKPRAGTETILLVEDDEAILNLGKIILEKLGYTVLTARTPVLAIHLAEEHPGELHLLITDVVMPEMNGRALAEQLGAFRPNLKCLYMSGYTADVIAHRGILDEGVNFIQKPFGSDEFAAKVRQVLDRLE